jgi:hypothetical protein
MRSLKPSPRKMFANGYPYERVVPQRPMVERKGDKVVKCFLHCSTKECLGTRCFWPKAGQCPIFDKLDKKVNGDKPVKKNIYGKSKQSGWVKNGKLKKV